MDQRSLGFIEISANSVAQQLSIVFEDGGGLATQIRFGSLYNGQRKECPAVLVNNGPYKVKFNVFFHPNTGENGIDLNASDFVCTPLEAGIEMTQRIMSCDPQQGVIGPFTQIPLKFICKTKVKEPNFGWRTNLVEEDESLPQSMVWNSEVAAMASDKFESNVVMKFQEDAPEKHNRGYDHKISDPCSVYMHVMSFMPSISVDKSGINFWECPIYDYLTSTLKITNRNEEMSVDFSFGKIAHFTVKPAFGTIPPKRGYVIVNVSFHPKNIGKISGDLKLRYVNNLYEIPIKLMGIGIMDYQGMDPKTTNFSKIKERMKLTRGPDALPFNFNQNEKGVKHNDINDFTVTRSKLFSQTAKKFFLPKFLEPEKKPKIEEVKY